MQSIFRQKKFRVFSITLALLAGVAGTEAASVSLGWTPSSDTNVVGYNIYYGTASGNYTGKVTVADVSSVTIPNFNGGDTYYFAATAFDSAGDESDFSTETQFIVPGVLALSSGTNPGDPMVIKFPVAPSHWYEVQASVDLQSWATIWQTDVATSNVWVQFLDPNASAFQSRFYRLVLH
jgi:hypothetical protein